ncbi:CRISPR-associated protein, Csm2 family [Leptotrichia sp. oral taxon 879 str. F0557]|nr:CRISPR-associated protein, Csm2 family [Leptotrichia sp. oral taxon 879 str. F0557]
MEIYYKFRKEFVMENKTVEELVKENKNNMVTTTQLRQLLSNSVIVKNKISSKILKKKDKLSDDLLNDVKYLLIKHTYQCGRESKVKEFDKKFEISERLKKIKTKEDFDIFYRYLEEIVAYVKYYIG